MSLRAVTSRLLAAVLDRRAGPRTMERTLPRRAHRARPLLLAALLAVASTPGCFEDIPATEVLVVVTSDIQGLERISVGLSEHSEDGASPNPKTVFETTEDSCTGADGEAPPFEPVSFSIGPRKGTTSGTFRLAVTGYGKHCSTGEDFRVVHQVTAHFRKEKELLHIVQLRRSCVDTLCDEEGQDFACDPADGECAAIPELDLQVNDPASARQSECARNASLRRVGATSICECNPGYRGDGTECTDEDECEVGIHGCDDNATCTNATGSFSCACKS